MNKKDIILDYDSRDGIVQMLNGSEDDKSLALEIVNNVDLNESLNVEHICYLMENSKLTIHYDFAENVSLHEISKKFKFTLI